MISLIIDNSYSRITGLSVSQFKSLRKVLSYTKPYNAFSPMMRRDIPLIDKSGNFPTGLQYLVNGWLNTNVKTWDIKDNRVQPKPNKALFGLPKFEHIPYKEQLEAADAAAKYKRTIISAITGSGKSLIAGLILYKLQVRTLIVVPSLELRTQLSDNMVSWFGEDRVGKGKDIWIENVQALDPKKPVKGYDCIIIDEFHHSGAKSYRKLNKNAWKDIYYRIGLTSTPFRSNEDERLLLESVLSSIGYRIPYKKAVALKKIVPVEAYYLELPKVNVEGYTWKEVYNELVVHNETRNDLINQLLGQLNVQNVHTLCLVKEISHGENICKLTKWYFANGVDEDSTYYLKLFNSEKLKTLIATQGYCGEGVDTKPAEYIIIAGLGKSKNQLMQAIGRGLRTYKGKESCKIIIFKDASHKYTLSHFKTQIKILRDEYGVTPIKIEI